MKKRFPKTIKRLFLGALGMLFLLSPFTVNIETREGYTIAVTLTQKKAYAECQVSNVGNVVTEERGETLEFDKVNCEVKDTSASFTFNIKGIHQEKYDNLLVKIYKDKDGVDDNGGVWNYGTGFVPPNEVQEVGVDNHNEIRADLQSAQTYPFKVSFSNLTPNTHYFAIAYLISPDQFNIGGGPYDTFITTNLTFTTGKDPNTAGTVDSVGGSNYTQDTGPDLGCSPLFFATLKNCLAALFYYVLYEPTAALARLAAHFLDFFVYYATNSDSYKSEFVTKAWGVVRDISNMFFIIALMVLAVRMILDIDKAHAKKTLSVIVMVALIINFSLFITRVVVDASNILAKVFYNNISSVDSNGNPVSGKNKEKSITVGLTRIIDPVKIMAKPADNVGNFIFIVFLCAGLMLGMAWIFFSSALFFVGRVISLWFSMIFGPLAFISYAVPFKIPEYGHHEWWSGLFTAAFMAPLFVFFLYITALFGGTLGAIPGDVATAGDWFTSMIGELVPFILVFGLLSAAKKIAKEYSGKFGEMVSKTGAVLGTLALGGAGLATAALGRKFIGSQVAKGGASEKAQGWAEHRMKFDEQLNHWKNSDKKNRGAKPTWDKYARTNGVDRNLGFWETRGAKANYAKLKVTEVEHARHEIEETKKKAGYEGVGDSQLKGAAKKKVVDQFVEDNKGKFEGDIKKGENKSGKPVMMYRLDENGKEEAVNLTISVIGADGSTTTRQAFGEEEYKTVRKKELTSELLKDSRYETKNKKGESVLNEEGKRVLNDRVNKEFGDILKYTANKMGAEKYSHLEAEAKEKVGLGKRLVARSDVGTYDARNFTQILGKMSAKDIGKRALGAWAIASAIRAGFKKVNLDMGKGQGDWVKDLKSTLTDALKKAPSELKVNVNLSGGGGGGHGGGGDHGGGHGGGGHGGGHGGH